MRKGYILLIAILLFLLFTNPTIKAFREYLGYDNFYGLSRKANFLICSVYQFRGKKYFGVAQNFIKLSKNIAYISPKLIDSTVIDSSKMTDTSIIMPIPITPYKYRVYNALKNNVNGFTLTKEEFYSKLQSENYQLFIYHLLKEKISGFTKNQEDFIQAINSN